MQLHVNARKMAYLGLMLAICEVLMVLGFLIRFNTLFFIACSALTVAICCFVSDLMTSILYFAAALILGFLILPQKEYLLTFSLIGSYLLFLCKVQPKLQRRMPGWLIWVLKLLLMNLFLIPLMIWFPGILFTQEVSSWVQILGTAAANVLVVICDYLFVLFEEKYRKKIETFFKRRMG